MESNWDKEGDITKHKKENVVVEYEGVEYGDDTQIEVQGNTKEE